ncbi:CHM2A protein, partial [Gymnorhina tibicen]|nr:CHM2A protein [Gymnorhina tibicen]
LLEFQKQSELMDMKEELMNDAIDDALGDEDDEDERWGHLVMLGDTRGTPGRHLGTARGTQGTPGDTQGTGRGGAEAASAALADADADLEERLKNLRRD